MAEQKRNCKQKEVEELQQLYNQALTRSTPDAQIVLNLYLEHKKALAKQELDEIKEKMELKIYRDFIDGEKPTKCFFSEI